VATSLSAAATVLAGVFASLKLVTGNLTEWFKRLTLGERLKRFQLPDYEAQLGPLHDIKVTLTNLCSLRLGASPVAGARCDTLVIVIDDLDRCMPKTVKEIFDAVRLVANIDRVVTILAIDDRIAFAAVEKHFDQFGLTGREPGQVARDYLAKVFQASLNLPPLGAATASAYVREKLFGFKKVSDAQALWDSQFDALNKLRRSGSAPDDLSGTAKVHELPVALELEAELFCDLASKTGIGNPRELWRMKQAWFILKAMLLAPGARMADMTPPMEALFMREWLLRASTQVRQRVARRLDTASATPSQTEAGVHEGPFEAEYVAWARVNAHLGAFADVVLLPGAPLDLAERR
jgi:hypothetical protein